MSYIINHLDILLGIFGIVLVVVAPDKQKKYGIAFVVVASLLFVIGIIIGDPKESATDDSTEMVDTSTITTGETNLNGTIEEAEASLGSSIDEDDTVSDNEENKSCKDVSITDETFDSGVRGMASLYRDTSKVMPTWFEGDLDDVSLSFIIDNIGTTYANIKHTKLIIDDFESLTMDDILLFREEAHAGAVSEVDGSVDLTKISPARSVYDVNFYLYNDNDEGIKIDLREGQTFNVDQSSQTRFIIYPQLAKSGIYTYHLKVNFEYYKTEYDMETEPVSFIYIAGNSDDYEYDRSELASLHLDKECYSEEYDMLTYYTIEGRTLIIHDTSTITYDNDFGEYFSLINTIIVEYGTKIIEAYAFGDEPGLYNVEKVYLPNSLDYLDVDCFYFNIGKLKTIYFGGTKKQWDSLIANSESDRIENIENVEIIYNYDY